MSFRDLKVGDKVVRLLGGENGVNMPMEVMAIEGDIIRCAAHDTKHWKPEDWWTFDRDLGGEEDHELGWGRKFGVTGSVLKKIEG